MEEAILSLFDTNTIHGYNPDYRDTGAGGRFDAFEMHHTQPRPVKFHNERVPGTDYLDHQGHIVPQARYGPRLLEIATLVDERLREDEVPYDLEQVTKLLVQHFPGLNFQTVTDYVSGRLIAAGGAAEKIFVDGTGDNVDDRLGGYFSVLNWNPVNICRAPSDDHRDGYPGDGADNAVALKLLADPNNPGITLEAGYAAFLQNHIGDLPGDVDAFLAACNASLAQAPVGFYQFSWSARLTPVL